MTKNEPTGPRTSVIVHPPELPMRITRQDYLVICCGNTCAADLLNVFEHWANSKGKETWIYRSAEGLRDDLLKQHSDKPIRDALELLLEWGYIERQNNPNMGFDRKYQYRLRIENIHAAIWYFYRMDVVDVPNASGKNTEAIKETRKETRKKTSPASGKKTLNPSIQETGEPPQNVNGKNGSAPAAQHKRSKADLDALYNLIARGSFNKTHDELNKSEHGTVLKIRKTVLESYPDITAEELKFAYVHYAAENPEVLNNDAKRLRSYQKIPTWFSLAIKAGLVEGRGNAHAVRDTDQWQQNREMYEAYAEAFGDRHTDAEILDLDIAVIQTWWMSQ